MKNKYNPYTFLLEQIISFFQKSKNRRVHQMFFYHIAKLQAGEPFRLDDVYHRVMAAQVLGYDVFIEANNNGMTFIYREKITVPDQWKE